MLLVNMRPTYVVQLLINIASSTATSDRWATMFKHLQAGKFTPTLVTMDSCCLNGIEEFCATWTDALNSLMNSEAIDAKAILTKTIPKPLSFQAQSMIGTVAATVAADDDSSNQQTLSVKQLLEFGNTDLIPEADQMAIFQLRLQAFMIETARPGGPTLKNRFV